jgi:hypothetical protein
MVTASFSNEGRIVSSKISTDAWNPTAGEKSAALNAFFIGSDAVRRARRLTPRRR